MERINRRGFLKGSLLTAASLGLPVDAGADAGTEWAQRGAGGVAREPLVDVNVYLGRWPLAGVEQYGDAHLVELLRRHGVTQAWVGAFEGLLQKDMAAVNARLAESVRRDGAGILVPFGSVNPKLPDWEEDLRRIHEVHGMPGIRLHPGYHNYTLEDPSLAELLVNAARRGLIVQIVPWMQDERHHHGLMQVPTPRLTPLAELARRMPGLPIVVLNGFRAAQGEDYNALATVENIYCDFAKLDVVNGLTDFLTGLPVERVLFGSYAPMFYLQSALLKLQESALNASQVTAIRQKNALRVRGRT